MSLSKGASYGTSYKQKLITKFITEDELVVIDNNGLDIADQTFSHCPRTVCTYYYDIARQQKHYSTGRKWKTLQQQKDVSPIWKIFFRDGQIPERQGKGRILSYSGDDWGSLYEAIKK